MYSTGAAHPGMYAHANANYYGNNGMRRPSVPAASQQYAGVPTTYAGQHQPNYDYQQGQSHIEMEIARMQLQNLELQKQLLMQAAAAAQQQASAQGGRRDRQSTPPMYGQQAPLHQSAIQRNWRSPSPSTEDDGARRDALQTLDRAQRQRHASATGVPTEGDFGAPRSRLSFGGGSDAAGLVESARARQRQSASLEPTIPATTMAPMSMSTPPPPQSIAAFATPSPPRPTLVLSKPGEAFPQTSPSPPGKRVGRHVKTDSHSSSSSSTSERSSTGSEHHSFESVATSVGGSASFEVKQPKLNASASAFTPSCAVAPPAIFASPPPPRVTAYRALRLAAQTGMQAGQKGAVAIRQPKGPAKEEELEAKNFASRIRRRAISSIMRGRNSFVAAEVPDMTANAPLSPTAGVFTD